MTAVRRRRSGSVALACVFALLATGVPSVQAAAGPTSVDIAAAQAELDELLALLNSPSPQAAQVDPDDEPEPLGVVVDAEAASPIAAGATAVFDASIYNNSEAGLAAPVTLTIGALPAGASFSAAETDSVGVAWSCDVATAICTLVDAADSATPVVLGPFEVVDALVTLQVAAGAAVATTVDVGVSATVGASTPPADLTNATATATFARLADGQAGALEVVANGGGLVANANSTTSLRIRNLGPAVVGGPGASVVATGILPPGVGDWTFTGNGWSCVDDAGRPRCAWGGSSVGAGERLDVLELSFIAPAEPTPAAQPLLFDTTVTHTTAAAEVTTEIVERRSAVLVNAAPSSKVFAKVVDDGAAEVGGSVAVEIGVLGSGFDDASRDARVFSTLPAGWTFNGSTAPSPWSCSASGRALSCERAAEFFGEAESSTIIELGVTRAAAIGPQDIDFGGVVTGPDAGAATTATVTLEVNEFARAALSNLRVFSYDATGAAEQVVNGTPVTANDGEPVFVGADILNAGVGAVPVGSTLTMSIELPWGSKIRSYEDGGQRWRCKWTRERRSDTRRADCSVTLDAPIEAGAASPRMKLRVIQPKSTEPGPAFWPLSVTAVSGNEALNTLAAATEVALEIVDVVATAPEINVVTDVAVNPRIAGRAGTLEVTVTNAGDAPMAGGWSFAIEMPAALTAQQRQSLPSDCRSANRTVSCTDSDALAAGAAGDLLSLPIPPPRTTDELMLDVEATAAGADDATASVPVPVLAAYSAIGTATPDRVSLPPSSDFPIPIVQLDASSSIAQDATISWTQLVAAGDPEITFQGFAPGATATGRRASFKTPDVVDEVTLRFELRLDDGNTSATTIVEVVVEPALLPDNAGLGVASGDAAQVVLLDNEVVAGGQPAVIVKRAQKISSDPLAAASRPLKALTPAGFAPPAEPRPDAAAALVSEGSGSWSITTPPVLLASDYLPDSPYTWTRSRVTDPGEYEWEGPGSLPTDVTVTTEWEECLVADPTTCTDPVTGDAYIVQGFPGSTVNAIITIAGIDSAGEPVSTSETYSIGEIQIPTSTVRPQNLVLPSIFGVVAVGETLTGTTGEWTIEQYKEVTWQRCTAVLGCAPIDGAQNIFLADQGAESSDSYVVQADDVADGVSLQFRVQSFTLQGDRGPFADSPRRSAETVDCGDACYTWSVDPTIDRDGAGGSVPATRQTASVIDNGTFAWNDPSPAPASPSVSVAWFSCLSDDPATCTEVGTGDTYVPTERGGGIRLEARVTVVGQAVDGSTRSSTLRVPFGIVADGSRPAATTAPSISGDPWVVADPLIVSRNVLTADPGVWSFATSPDRSYEWFRCEVDNPNFCSGLGVTTSTYTITEADLTETATTLRVDVTATGLDGPTTVRSAPTDVVSGFRKRLISPPFIQPGAAPRGGDVLTAGPAVWSEMPPTVEGPDFSWTVIDANGNLSGGGTGPTFVVPTGQAGDTVRFSEQIRFQDPLGSIQPASALSAPTAPLLSDPLVLTTDLNGVTPFLGPGGELTIRGFATGGDGGPLTGSWSQPAEPGDPNILRDFDRGNTIVVKAPIDGSGTMVFRYSVVDESGDFAFIDVSVDYGPPTGVASELCEAIAIISDGDSTDQETLAYGDIDLQFFSSSVPDRCDETSRITIPNADIDVYGVAQLRGSVVLDANGLTLSLQEVDLTTGTRLDDELFFGFGTGQSFTMAFEPADGTYEITGSIIGGTPGIITPTSDWRGAFELGFESTNDEQSLSLEAVAWFEPGFVPTPVADGLPLPPDEAPVTRLIGTISTDNTFSLEVSSSGMIDIAGVIVDFEGSITRSDPAGPLEFAAAASVTDVPLNSDLTLDSAELAWDGETFTGAGALTLTAAGVDLAIDASFGFTDPDNWRASLSVGATGTWTPIPDLDFINPRVSGTISRVRQDFPLPRTTSYSVNVSADRIAIGVGDTFSFDRPSLGVSGTCADGDCEAELTLTTAITFDGFAQGDVTANLAATVDSSTGEFDGSIVTSANLAPGLSIFGDLAISNVGGSLDIALDGRVFVFGSTVAATVAYNDEGALVLVEVGDWTPFRGAPTIDDAWLVLSSYETTIEIGGEEVDIPERSLTISAEATLPDWFTDLIGANNATGTVFGQIVVDPLEFSLDISFELGSVEVFDIEGVRLSLETITLSLTAGENGFSAAIDGGGILQMPSIGGEPPSQLAIIAGLYYRSSGGVGGYVELAGIDDNPAWTNAFGVEDFIVDSFTLDLSFGGFQGTSLGFEANVILPDTWGAQIGILPDAPISLKAAISTGAGCFGIEIGEPGSDVDVLDIANLGAVTATYASLYIAPTGCAIGRDTVIGPGAGLVFEGAVFDVGVDASLAIAPVPGGVEVIADIEIDPIQLGDIIVEGAVPGEGVKLGVEISPTVKALSFSGRVEMFGAEAIVDGAFRIEAGVSIVDFSGSLSTPDLGGFELEELSIDFTYSPGNLVASAVIAVSVLDQPQTATFGFTMLNGVVVEANGTADINIEVNGLAISGSGSFVFVQGEFPEIDITGSASVEGRQLTTVSATLRAGFLEFSAEIAKGGIFTEAPRIEGTVVWGSSSAGGTQAQIVNVHGERVDAAEGDFRFAATNVGIGINDFTLNANVAIGRVGGVFFADVNAGLNFGLSGNSSVAIDFAGQFQSTGDITLTGSGRLVISGIPSATFDFSISRQGGAVALSASASLTIPQLGAVAVAGSFEHDSDVGWLFEITGTLAIKNSTHDFGSGAFTARRAKSTYSSGTFVSMRASVNVNIPDLATGSATVRISSNGNFYFDAALTTQGKLRDAIGLVEADVSFGSTGKYDFDITVEDVMKIDSKFTISGSVEANGSFEAGASASIPKSGLYTWTWDRNGRKCDPYYSVGGTVDVAVDYDRPTASFSISGDVDATVEIGCGDKDFNVDIDASFSYDSGPPVDFGLRIKLEVDFFVFKWRPTVVNL